MTTDKSLDLLQKSDTSSFPEFFDRKILRESGNTRMLWIALEFVLRQIQAMTGFCDSECFISFSSCVLPYQPVFEKAKL
jgi:hypothetical protein